MRATMHLPFLLAVVCCLIDSSAIAQTDKSQQETPDDSSIDLLSQDNIDHWEAARFGGQGEYSVSKEQIELGFGYMMTGVIYQGKLPQDNYRVRYQAKRIEGTDFFGTLTFPVRDSHCSLVLGGWGGPTVGLSCIDGEDASRNDTMNIMGLDDDKWHQVELTVQYPKIECRINGEQIFETDVQGKEVSVRGDVRVCRPFGFCSFETIAQIRKVHVIRLDKPSD